MSVLPSLLDRLLDDPVTEATATALQRAVRRDVLALLNARRPWRTASHAPNAGQSLDGTIRCYGIADTTLMQHELRRPEPLQKAILSALERFEPRLVKPRVEMRTDPALPDRAAHVVISGRIVTPDGDIGISVRLDYDATESRAAAGGPDG